MVILCKIRSLIDRSLIDQSVKIPGYRNRFSYDEAYHSSRGFWICTACKSEFQDANFLHKDGCSLKGRVQGYGYTDDVLIYIIGPQVRGRGGQFQQAEIERIKNIAKTKSIL